MNNVIIILLLCAIVLLIVNNRNIKNNKLNVLAYRVIKSSEYNREFSNAIKQYQESELDNSNTICIQNLEDLKVPEKTIINVHFNNSLIYSSKNPEKVNMSELKDGDIINATITLELEGDVFILGQKATFSYSSSENRYYIFFVFNKVEDTFYVIPSTNVIH